MKKLHLFLLLFALVFTLMYSCKKDTEPAVPAATGPVVGTSNVSTPPTHQTVDLQGRIESMGGSAITQHGHVYSETVKLPTLADSKTESGTQAGPFPATFSSALTGLKPATTYYVRAYATNAQATGYGTVLEVKTTEVKLPTLDNASTTDSLTSGSFRIQSSITDKGSETVTQHGHVYSETNKTPTLADTKTEWGSHAGPFPATFVSKLANLKPNTVYYVRPYATSQGGTAYGTVLELKTAMLEIILASLDDVSTIDSVTSGSFRIQSTLKSSGNGTISQHGHVYSATNPLPTLADAKSQLGTREGALPAPFMSRITNLQDDKSYYVRPYATNEKGTVYGVVKTVRTVLLTVPVLNSIGLSADKTATRLRPTSTLQSTGGAAITEFGFVASKTNTSPTLNDLKVRFVNTPVPASNRFEADITQLEPNTKYYIRGYASNSKGTGYSPVISGTTLEDVPTFARPASFEDVPIYSLQVRFQTADVTDADTDDEVYLLLTSSSSDKYILDHGSNLNHSEDDRERKAIETYEIAHAGIKTIKDILYFQVVKVGKDGWKFSKMEMLVNGRVIFSKSFSTPVSIDEDDGDQPSYWLTHEELRAHANWSFANNPTIHVPNRTVTRDEIDALVEGAIGHEIHTGFSNLKWSTVADVVEVSYKNETDLHVDIDLRADNFLDGAVDVDFDLYISCAYSGQPGSPANIVVKLWNFKTDNSDFKKLFTQTRIDQLSARLASRLYRNLLFSTYGPSTCKAVVNSNGSISFW